MNEKKLTITGIIFTIIATAGFLWAAIQWHNTWKEPDQATVHDLQLNEQHTFLNLQTISRAQKKYKETDWDGDGKKVFSKYFIHLWTSVSPSSDPISVNLIPREIAFATEASRAIDGYYFTDLHDLDLPEERGKQSLNYESQWAVVAMPTDHGLTGILNFLADSSGGIFVNPAKYIPTLYPEVPASKGWIKIDTIQQLQEYQKKLSYPQNSPKKPL
ncbi:MAG: DUF2950 family protein [Phycisphaerae bacterium]|nr:DUF2950 family protein [Phycisphaerae bacterium]